MSKTSVGWKQYCGVILKNIIKGDFEPIPETYSSELQNIIKGMIRVSSSRRPTGNLILSYAEEISIPELPKSRKHKAILSRKIINKKLRSRHANSNMLMSSILWGDDLKVLSSILPSNTYSDEIIMLQNNSSLMEYSKNYPDYHKKSRSIIKDISIISSRNRSINKGMFTNTKSLLP